MTTTLHTTSFRIETAHKKERRVTAMDRFCQKHPYLSFLALLFGMPIALLLGVGLVAFLMIEPISFLFG